MGASFEGSGRNRGIKKDGEEMIISNSTPDFRRLIQMHSMLTLTGGVSYTTGVIIPLG